MKKSAISLVMLTSVLPILTGCSRQRGFPNAEPATVTEGGGALENKRLEDVTPSTGFAYFSGNLNTNRSFPTIYYSAGLGSPQLTILAPDIELTYPFSEAETAFRIYRLICEKEAAEWRQDRDVMMFAQAYLIAASGRQPGQLEDILKHVPKDQHEKMTRMFLRFKETGSLR